MKDKILDYAQLVKVRLSFLVVFSAAMSYLWASNRQTDALVIWLLSVGGFFITASSNILNQIIERESDRLMKRTMNRPLAAGRMSIGEAITLASFLGITGIFLLFQINLLAAVLGAIAMLIYAALYTPLKRVTALTIIPGAVAGSLPVVIGWVASTGAIEREAVILFLVQFAWQFPHTWSIAWLLNDEYNKAGLKMLPTSEKNNTSALLIMISTFLIIPSALLFYMYESAGFHVMWILVLAGLGMAALAYRHYRVQTDKTAVKLMLSCFAYLPLVLIILVVEKFL